ncbi:ribonuclease HI [Bifidobacterium rousetti]|nr:ribonuclease HI [Bifidobacterium rousetti]
MVVGMAKTIVVSTDGSALGNPNGPMGWAWADHDTNAGGGRIPGHEHDSRGYDAGGATNGTNQIGELCAVLQVLRAHPGPEPLLIESDSQYAINCSTKWLKGWKRNGWRNSQKQPVKNVEIIKAIDAEIAKRPGPVDFKWVKGHAGNAGNELVDELARTYAQGCRKGSEDGYLPLEGWQSLLNSPYAKGTDVPPDAQLMLDRGTSAGAGAGEDRGADRETSRAVSDKTGRTGKTVKTTTATTAKKPSAASKVTTSDTTVPEVTPSKAVRPDTQAAAPSTRQPSTPATTQPAAQPAPATQATQATQTMQATQPAPVASGLKVSGEVRFSPAPKTSPYFTGEAMHIRGYIAVDGFVDGDGNLTITDADFLR